MEISPHPVLTAGIEDAAQSRTPAVPVTVVGSLRRGEGGPQRFLLSLATAHAGGVPVDWRTVFAGPGTRRVQLPTYPFQRRRHWLDDGSPAAPRPEVTAGPAAEEHQEPTLRQQLAGRGEAERTVALGELVRAHAAVVLGHEDAAAVDVDATFKELGLDSVTAVDLRNRLTAATGLALPTTLVFSHPTPAALTRHLATRLTGTGDTPAADPTAEPAVRTDAFADEPIAIVGMACRLPGDADSPEALWRLLVEGTDAVSAVPTDRGWDPDAPFWRRLVAQRRVPARRRRVRRRVLRHQPPRGAVDGPAAAAAAGDVLGGAGAGRRRPRRGLAAAGPGSSSARWPRTTAPACTKYPASRPGYALTGTSPSVLSGRIAYRSASRARP